jgi:hypothetical protein
MRNLKKISTVVFAAVLLLQLIIVPTAFAANPTGSDGDFDWLANGDSTATITAYTGAGGAVIIPGTLSGYTVTQINCSTSVFKGKTAVTSISIPESVTTIEAEAFSSCTGLTSVTFESGSDLTAIPDKAFSGCTGLTSFEIPSGVISIGKSAFDGCAGISSVKLSSSLATIDEGAFSGLPLTSVNIPASVTDIGVSAFAGCTKLTSLTFSSGSNLHSIGTGAFSGDILLTTVTLPDSLGHLNTNAFSGCTALWKVVIPGDSVEFGDTVFASTSMAAPAHGIYANLGSTAETYSNSHHSETYFYSLEFAIGTPVITSAVSTGYSTAMIKWTAADRATSYEIRRSTSTTFSSAPVAVSGTSYADKNLTTNTKYYYEVRGCTTSANGEWSDPVAVTPMPYAPTSVLALPGTPPTSGTGAMTNTYNSITLTWSIVGGADGYKIYRSYSYGGTYELLKTIANPTTTPTTTALSSGQVGVMSVEKKQYTFKSITTGRTYYYKIRAYKSGSPLILGDYSAVAYATPRLEAVTNLAVTVASPTSLKLTWNAVVGRSSYEIYRGLTSTGPWTKVGRTSGTVFTNKSLNVNTTYYYYVVAYRSTSQGKAYGPISSIMSGTPVILKVTGVTATPYTTTKIKIAWTKQSGVSGYYILRSDTSGGEYKTIGQKSYSYGYFYDTELTTGSTYYYKVQAYKYSTLGPLSDYSSSTTKIATY